jgi:hypothetical protein
MAIILSFASGAGSQQAVSENGIKPPPTVIKSLAGYSVKSPLNAVWHVIHAIKAL